MTLLERAYEAWNAHDIDGLLSHFDPQMVYKDMSTGTTIAGTEYFRERLKLSFESIPDIRFELIDPLCLEDRFASRARMFGTFTASIDEFEATGSRFEVNYATIGRIRNGLIVEAWDYFNLSEWTGTPS